MSLLSYYHPDFIEAGCDEAGRGCLAGPVFAAAVIFPKDYTHCELNDSKLLSAKTRYKLREEIERDALAFAVASVNNLEIDKINIVQASVKAMHKALTKLAIVPQFIIIDGNYFHAYKKIPHQCHVKGDSKYLSIAAASILAKTYRDDFMQKLHREFPNYLWCENKGYATADHRQAVQQYGLTCYHRRSFCSNYDQLSLDFNEI
jgi:ribonuclease HII